MDAGQTTTVARVIDPERGSRTARATGEQHDQVAQAALQT